MTLSVERILEVIELGSSETQDQENMVDENLREEQLRNFIRKRKIQKDVIEITTETLTEE